MLQVYHDHPLAGHPGIANTVHLLSQVYQGKDMKNFAESYVRGCVTCQQNKLRTTHRKAPLQLITVDPHSGPFQMVAMDLITDLLKSQGFDTVLTVIDHGCSKAAKFIPCNTTITGQDVVVLYLEHLVLWFGIPRKIISDCDPRFVLNFTKELCRLLHIQQNVSTAFHPRTDGTSKQANQWLEQYLRIWTADDQTTWAQFLSLAEFVHNSWPHDQTSLTPHKLLFETKPPFPLSNEEAQTPDVTTCYEYMTFIPFTDRTPTGPIADPEGGQSPNPPNERRTGSRTL